MFTESGLNIEYTDSTAVGQENLGVHTLFMKGRRSREYNMFSFCVPENIILIQDSIFYSTRNLYNIINETMCLDRTI